MGFVARDRAEARAADQDILSRLGALRAGVLRRAPVIGGDVEGQRRSRKAGANREEAEIGGDDPDRRSRGADIAVDPDGSDSDRSL